MAEIFAADSVNNTATTTIATTTETVVVTGNFISPPYGNAKAVIMGTVDIATGTGTVFLTFRIRRNPGAENVVVLQQLDSTPAPNTALRGFQVADAIPDGRAVQYQVSVQQNAATANGSVAFANVTVLLISG